jgi:hypothetical protein
MSEKFESEMHFIRRLKDEIPYRVLDRHLHAIGDGFSVQGGWPAAVTL